MITPEQDELLQRDLDGVLSPEEAATVGRLLVENGEARARREALRRLWTTLTGAAEDPPADLVTTVMGRLPDSPSRPWRVADWWEEVRLALARPVARRQALAFAAGLLLGGATTLLLLSERMPDTREDAGMSATVLPDVRLASAVALDRAPFEEGELRGELSTRLADGRLLAEIRIDSAVSVEVVVDFDSKVLVAAGFEQNAAQPAQVALGPGQLRLQNAGPGLYRLVLETRGEATPGLRITVKAANRTVERSLRAQVSPRTGDGSVNRGQLFRT